jgi:signal transduction histidine kinase/DNA-binding response OmpR family regulator
LFKRALFLHDLEEIYHIQEDSLGRIWFGTRFGLGMYNYTTDAFHWILTGHNVQAFVIEEHEIWMATWNHGLCMLNFRPAGFGDDRPVFDSTRSVFSPEREQAQAQAKGAGRDPGGPRNCISIYRDDNQITWLGTYETGLVRAAETGEGISFTTYDMSAGAPSNAVYGVSGDEQGYIWISTQQGLGRFDPDRERFDNFYREDGLLSNFFMWKAYHRASDGELYFGSVDGLNMFYPGQIRIDTVKPRLFISELRIHNRLVESGDTLNGDRILSRHIAYQDTITLNHWNRDFSFGFYATGHPNPKKLIYSYILEGFDKEWNENAPGNRNATYNNLSPGTYQFRVRVTESNTEWYGRYSAKVVVVMPPWWKTRLAYIGYILLLSGLIFLITRSLIRFLGLKQELIYNEKLHQSKLMFFTNISHEFKAPLSLIKAPLNEILNEKELSPHNRKNLNVAKQNADNLLNLVDELMEFRRTDTGVSKLRAEKIELTEFVREIVDQFEYLAKQKGVHFYFNIPNDPVTLWADKEKLRKIINNLLENAFRYTSREGLVTLSIMRSPSRFGFKPNYHTLQLNQSKKEMTYAGIVVSDTGVGISRESLPKIFDRFYQIEAERASHHIGSGIGLALVKNLVLMHQGEIQVASERGMGTEILVLLPLGDSHLKDEQKTVVMYESPIGGSSENENIPVTAGPATVQKEVPGLPGILLVEDHEELRQYLVENLSDEYRFYEASNGAEGLEILKEQRPDLIITDWIMPEMDGAAFIEAIRTDDKTSSIPVILLTAKDEVKDWQDGLEMGADQVIPKPFNLQLLRTQLRRIIANNRNRIRKYSLATRENLADFQEDSDARFIEQVEHIINEHIGDTGLNAAMIARELGVSRTSLYDRIRVLTGQTIGECIQKTRLEQAVKLMLYKNITVSEVYVMVGFSSSSYLIRLFKKYYQTTPKEYVRNYLRTAPN